MKLLLRKICRLLIISCIFQFAFLNLYCVNANAVQSVPTIFRVNDAVAPGEAFNVFGEGLNISGVRVKVSLATVALAPTIIPDNALDLNIVFADAGGHFLTVQLQDSAQAGMYYLWVVGDQVQSNVFLLNAPRPQWLSNEKVAQGQTLKLIGRNLSPVEYGGLLSTLVRLKNANNTVYPEIVEINPFAIEFKIAESTPKGVYTFECSTGNDIWIPLEFEEYGTTVEVIARVSDPFLLNVWWAGLFKYTNVYNVSDYGVVANSNADSTVGIQNVINKAYTAGGGIVFIPDGTYNIKILWLRDGVVLKGNSKESTILRGISDGILIRCDKTYSLKGTLGVANLKLTLPSMTPSFNVPDAAILFSNDDYNLQKVFATNVSVVMPQVCRAIGTDIDGNVLYEGRGMGVFAAVSRDIIVQNSDFVGYKSAPSCTRTGKYSLFKNLQIKTTAGNIGAVGSAIIMENNDVEIIRGNPDPRNFLSEGLVTRGPSYIANNSIKHTGRIMEDGGSPNDGELVMTENAGERTKSYGNILSSTQTGVLVKPIFLRDVDISSPNWGYWYITIIEGKGLGQYRRLTNMEVTTSIVNPPGINDNIATDQTQVAMSIAQPWSVTPDVTSKYSVNCLIKAPTLYNNTAYDGAKGYWFYNDAVDGIMHSNKGDNTEGCYINTYYIHKPDASSGAGDYRFTLSYFNRLQANEVQGISYRSRVSLIGEAVKLETSDTFGVNSYGTMIKGNKYLWKPLDKEIENSTVPVLGSTEAPDINGIMFGFANKIDNITRPAAQAAILQKNYMENSARGITIGGNLWPGLGWDTSSTGSRGANGIVVSGNTFKNVDVPYTTTLDIKDTGLLDGGYLRGFSVDLLNGNQKLTRLTSGNLKVRWVFRNNNRSLNNTTIMLALYKNNKLQRIVYSSKILNAFEYQTFEQNITLSNQDVDGSSLLKCMLWERLDSANPKQSAVEFRP